jgi:hypothetical protein
MASDKAKATSAAILAADLLSEAPKSMSISEADAQTAALIDAAVAPLLDALTVLAKSFRRNGGWLPEIGRVQSTTITEAECATLEALLRAWGRQL